MSNPYAETADIRRTQRHIVTMPDHRPDPGLQPALLEPAGATAEPTIQQQFEQFNARNPHVYLALRDMALAQVRAGRQRVSVKLLVEQLRASEMPTTGEVFKFDNRYTSRYARMLQLHPELRERIPTRTLSAE